MKDRISLLRRTLGLSQKEFGLNLGCSRDKIANIELGRVSPDDVFIKHICVVYHVREIWMRTGAGEIWEQVDSNVRYRLESYETLPPTVKSFIDAILLMPDKDLSVLESLLKKATDLANNRIES